MKNPLTHRVSSADRSVSSIIASKRVSAPITAGLLLCVGMITGCSEPTARGGISEPDPELVFVRGYRSTDDDCKLTGESGGEKVGHGSGGMNLLRAA